ncbi:NAD(P)/FAD-dependent oxidoreductase [Brevundimonas bullata]|uniref:NAD(P)/FAD-dependent oxidoreductase n=1 Tax=Brevundimonas bullata TaxID=13160 RepID=UPI002FDAAAD6
MPARIVIIGGGVVGLAVGRRFALNGHEVYILEAADHIGGGVSSRNSEVIHAGIYYPHGSLMHRHCINGRRQLYQYLTERRLPFRRCEKLIVATTPSEDLRLDHIEGQAARNEVEGVERLDQKEASRLEGALRCTSALLSQETGILDSHAFMSSLKDDIEGAGSSVVLSTPFLGAERQGQNWRVSFGGRDLGEIGADVIVNCAGLSAQKAAATISGYPVARIPRQVLAKGNYFRYAGRPVFSRLIYPVPDDGGLGVHLTLDLAGQMRFGPDVQWVDEEDYSVDSRRADAFYDTVRRYWPGLPQGALEPDYCGIRPKLRGPNEPHRDFVIDTQEEHGILGLVQLFGIESPGLTASLSLADYVYSKVF